MPSCIVNHRENDICMNINRQRSWPLDNTYHFRDELLNEGNGHEK
jgi:hypothetical protein